MTQNETSVHNTVLRDLLACCVNCTPENVSSQLHTITSRCLEFIGGTFASVWQLDAPSNRYRCLSVAGPASQPALLDAEFDMALLQTSDDQSNKKASQVLTAPTALQLPAPFNLPVLSAWPLVSKDAGTAPIGLFALAPGPRVNETSDHPIEVMELTLDTLTHCLEVTQSRHVQARLQRGIERYRSLVATTYEIVWVVAADGCALRRSTTWENYTGQQPQDYLGRGWLAAIHPDDRAFWGEVLSPHGSTFSAESRIRRADGTYRTFKASGVPVREADGEIREWVGCCIDVTDRKLAEEKLWWSENRYRTLVSAMSQIVWTVTPALAARSDLQSWMNFTGQSAQESAERGYLAMIHPADRERALEEFRTAVDQRHHYESEYRLLRHDGVYRHVVSRGAPVFDANGDIQEWIGACTDITERKEAELALQKAHADLERRVDERTRELSAANAQLLQLDRLKSMFIASMSHELRTPLNSIIGFTGLVLQGLSGPINEKQQDQLSRVYSSAGHLLTLINDIIDISKVEAGYIDTFATEVDISEVIAEAIETIQPLLAGKPVRIKHSGATTQSIVSDRKRVLQCVLNVLSNAAKYTEHGTITINSRHMADGVRIAITDTGIGIAPSDVCRLFKPFERLHANINMKIQGTGLGLYLTKKIVTQILEGRLEVTSQPGSGSTFTLILPKRLSHLANPNVHALKSVS